MPGQRSDRDTLRSRRHRSIRASQRTNAACRQCRPAPVGSVGGSAPACPCIAGTAATSTASASSGTRNPRATVPDNDNDNNKEHICVSGRHQRLQATPAELFVVRYRRCHPAYSGSSRSLHRRGTPCNSARPMDRCSRAHCAAALTTRVCLSNRLRVRERRRLRTCRGRLRRCGREAYSTRDAEQRPIQWQ